MGAHDDSRGRAAPQPAQRAAATGRSGYSLLSIALHWGMALMILGNLAAGLVADGLMESADANDRLLGARIIGAHQSVGLTVLVLALARLGLRLVEGFPPLPDHMTPTERLLARISHRGFYLLMVGIPLAGWLMVSAGPGEPPTEWFGLFAWPDLPVERAADTARAAGQAHEWLAFSAIGLVVLHVAGALKHHWMDRDDVLARMIPALSRHRG